MYNGGKQYGSFEPNSRADSQRSHRFDEFRRIVLQMDRENSRKKSIAGLTRLTACNDLAMTTLCSSQPWLWLIS
jgi:hypothetical protein